MYMYTLVADCKTRRFIQCQSQCIKLKKNDVYILSFI